MKNLMEKIKERIQLIFYLVLITRKTQNRLVVRWNTVETVYTLEPHTGRYKMKLILLYDETKWYVSCTI